MLYPRSIFLSKNKKNTTIFHLIVFTAVKYCRILHRRVIVMSEPAGIYHSLEKNYFSVNRTSFVNMDVIQGICFF